MAQIGGERLRVHLLVATLGYSRRMHIRPSLREHQMDWFERMEDALPGHSSMKILGQLSAKINRPTITAQRAFDYSHNRNLCTLYRKLESNRG